MHSPTPNASHPLPAVRNGSLRTHLNEDRIYQIVTVAAILTVLGTLWIF